VEGGGRGGEEGGRVQGVDTVFEVEYIIVLKKHETTILHGRGHHREEKNNIKTRIVRELQIFQK